MLWPAFEESSKSKDFSRYGWATQLETLLSNALVEQQLFDCKQGFYTLDAVRKFDELSFYKICRTLSAMANAGRGVVGHVVVGIADKESDAKRVADLDGLVPQSYKHFRIVGIDRETILSGKSLNDYWTWLNQRFKTNGLDVDVAKAVTGESRLVPYRGRTVGVFKVTGGTKPVFFDGSKGSVNPWVVRSVS